MKRCQESLPALISVIFFNFYFAEQSELPLIEKRERQENCHYTMFDEKQLDPHGVSNLLHVFTIISPPHLESEEELSALITDDLKFQTISGATMMKIASFLSVILKPKQVACMRRKMLFTLFKYLFLFQRYLCF